MQYNSTEPQIAASKMKLNQHLFKRVSTKTQHDNLHEDTIYYRTVVLRLSPVQSKEEFWMAEREDRFISLFEEQPCLYDTNFTLSHCITALHDPLVFFNVFCGFMNTRNATVATNSLSSFISIIIYTHLSMQGREGAGANPSWTLSKRHPGHVGSY